jgi:mannose-6-phosphate isomerase-like protein (cupin superfamily)
MSVIEGKVWGTTEPILQSAAVEVHRIKVELGAYCSQHKHQSKINMFYVISGELEIQRWKDYGLCDSTHLFAGDTSIVPAGEMHKFIAHQETEALEIYWAELNHNDIQRTNVGGASYTDKEKLVEDGSILGNLFTKVE